jgi:hypothetical protein
MAEIVMWIKFKVMVGCLLGPTAPRIGKYAFGLPRRLTSLDTLHCSGCAIRHHATLRRRWHGADARAAAQGEPAATMVWFIPGAATAQISIAHMQGFLVPVPIL